MKALKPLFLALFLDFHSCFKTTRSGLVSGRPNSHVRPLYDGQKSNHDSDKAKTLEPQNIRFLKKGELFNLQCDRPGGNSILSLYYQPTLENISGKEQLFQIWGQNPYGNRNVLRSPALSCGQSWSSEK